MSMMPASRVELKTGLSNEERAQTVEHIRSIAGQFNLMSHKEPYTGIVNTGNPQKLAQIRALPGVARVSHQL